MACFLLRVFDQCDTVKTYSGYRRHVVVDLIDSLHEKDARFQVRRAYGAHLFYAFTAAPATPARSDLRQTKAAAHGYQHAKSMPSVNYFFFKYI